MTHRYIIRKAANSYWLLDMTIKDKYRPPLKLNETGAMMAELIIQGMDDETIAHTLAKELDVSEAELCSDVTEFRQALSLEI